MTEQEKMLAGELYNPADPELGKARHRARGLCQQFNATQPFERLERVRLLRELLGSGGKTANIEPPFQCDYGSHIHLGKDVFFNFNCVVLDTAKVTIGARTMMGPAVQIYTPLHPMDATERRTMLEYSRPVTIGEDVWIGGGAIICPGVTIGDRAVIGAGSVVTRDIPADVFAAGNPCRVLRPIES